MTEARHHKSHWVFVVQSAGYSAGLTIVDYSKALPDETAMGEVGIRGMVESRLCSRKADGKWYFDKKWCQVFEGRRKMMHKGTKRFF